MIPIILNIIRVGLVLLGSYYLTMGLTTFTVNIVHLRIKAIKTVSANTLKKNVSQIAIGCTLLFIAFS